MQFSKAAARAKRPLADFKADRRLLVLSAMAPAVGVGGALSAWVLVRLISLVTNLVWFGHLGDTLPSLAHAPRTLWMIVAPVLGGLAVGLMARYGSDKIRGHGIPEAIEAILIGGSRMSPRVALLKPLSSAVAIGTGGPFGAEGPIIMSGGAIGSLFAQFFRLSSAERKTLLVAGAAAGMTGIFNTPVAAVLLAVELLLFEWRPRSLVPVVTAVVTAACLRPFLIGSGPMFAFTGELGPAWGALPASAGFGLAIGLFSCLITKTLYGVEDGFERIPLHWMWWPAIGGLVVGLGGLIEPRALSVGYDVIGDLLNGHLLLGAVIAILLVKAVIWLVALSSGTSGGVLAPLLIIGGAIGWLAGLVLPGAQGAWALIGMAAMLGGTMRAPLMSAVFAVELTGDLAMLPAILAAAAASYAVTVLIMRRSILTEKIARRGQHVASEYGVDPFELARVRDIMVRKVDVLEADMQAAEAMAALEHGRHHVYPVVDASRKPVGLTSRADALRWEVDGLPEGAKLLDQIHGANPVCLQPDDLATQAVEVMLDTGQSLVPVVETGTGAIVGLVTRLDLLQVRAGAARAEEEREAYLSLLRPRARTRAPALSTGG